MDDHINQGISNFNDIDVSNITDFSYLFYECKLENINVSDWDVSNGTNFRMMFADCKNFNQDLSHWNVMPDAITYNMFVNCKKLKHYPSWYKNDITTKIKPTSKDDLIKMIKSSLKGFVTSVNFNHIDVSGITDFSYVFSKTSLTTRTKRIEIFIDEWDVSNGTDFRGMFNGCSTTIFDVSNWDVSNGTDFREMFCGCSLATFDVSQWNVSNGVKFGLMFSNCSNFNSDVSNWDVSKGKNFEYMF